MKPFDLTAALSGSPVITRDGRSVTQLTKFDGGENTILEPLAGVIEGKIRTWHINGRYLSPEAGEHEQDLVMGPVKHTAWMVKPPGIKYLQSGNIFWSHAAAMQYAFEGAKVIKIEWEE